MKTSLIWAAIAIASITIMIGLITLVRYNVKENHREYELARRRVEEQIAAFRKADLTTLENRPQLRVITHMNEANDNVWNIEHEVGKSA